jgi:glycosyltransferase involved in cell wall biosynthesis
MNDRELRTSARRSLDIPDDVFVVLMSCRLFSYKGVLGVLSRATEFLDAKSMLLIAGDGETRNEAEGFIRECNLGRQVRLLGHVQDMPRLYKAADVFLHNAIAEGQPYAILEAMQAALPIVARRSLGVAELISHGRTGLLFESLVEMTMAIAHLRNSQEDRRGMGQATKEYVSHHHLLTRQVQELISVYEEQCRYN